MVALAVLIIPAREEQFLAPAKAGILQSHLWLDQAQKMPDMILVIWNICPCQMAGLVADGPTSSEIPEQRIPGRDSLVDQRQGSRRVYPEASS